MSKDSGLWSKFSKAEECLDEMSRNEDHQYALFAKDVKTLFKQAQKIYFPTSRKIMTGKKITAELAELVKIPFPVTVILTEAPLPVSEEVKQIYSGDLKFFDSYSLIVAFDPLHIPSMLKSEFDLEENTICFVPMLEIPKEVRSGYLEWGLVPMLYTLSFKSGIGYEMNGVQASKKHYDEEAFREEGINCIDTITNTFSLLNLENTEAVEHKAPNALNKARERRGKSKLYDYKVLVVDGERWDINPRSSSNGGHDGVRSHFRRGHIRRLQTGKAVWVRHTVVHGSREGFVEKTYSLESKNAIHQVSASV